MASISAIAKGEETIEKIQVETRRTKRGNICTHATLFFKSGRKFKTNSRGYDNKVEQFIIGECVTTLLGYDGIIGVLKKS